MQNINNIVKMEIDEDLRRMERTLKNTFVRAMSVKKGRPYKPTSRTDSLSCWEGAAKLCMKLQADPEDFIQAQLTLFAGYVVPSMLGGKKATNNYYKYVNFIKGENDAPIVIGDTSRPAAGAALDRYTAFLEQCKVFKKGAEEIGIDFFSYLCQHAFVVDAVACMMVYGHRSDICKAFQEKAQQELAGDPSLVEGIKALNFSRDNLNVQSA